MMTKWAIVGTGGIARQFAGDLTLSGGSVVSAVASRNPDKAKAFAKAVGGKAVAMTFDDVLRSDDVDAVYLATPNGLHASQAVAIIEAGKPVLIEKPLATTAGDAERVLQASRASNVLAMEAMWMRFTPAIVRLKQMVASGELGEIRQFHANLAFPSAYGPDKAIFDPASGGAALDLGVYGVSLMLHLLGTPERFETLCVSADNDSVMTGGVLATYPGAAASVAFSLAAEGDNQATIVGDRGAVTVSRLFISSPMLTIRRNYPPSGPVEDVETPMPSRLAPPKGFALKSLLAPLKSKREINLFKGRGLYFQADHFSELIARGVKDSPVMPLAESVEAIRIVQRAGSGSNDVTGR